MKNKNTNSKIRNSSSDGNRCNSSRINDARNTSNDLRELRNSDLREVTRGENKDRLY